VGVDPAAPAGVYKIWGEALEIDCQDRQAGRIPAEHREGLRPCIDGGLKWIIRNYKKKPTKWLKKRLI
jgi:hypothetical protein